MVRLRRRRGAQHLDQHGAGPGAGCRTTSRSIWWHGHQRHSHAAVWRDAGRDGRLHRRLDQRENFYSCKRLLRGPFTSYLPNFNDLRKKPRGGQRFRLSTEGSRCPTAAQMLFATSSMPADHRKSSFCQAHPGQGDLPWPGGHCLHLLSSPAHRKGRVRVALVHGRPHRGRRSRHCRARPRLSGESSPVPATFPADASTGGHHVRRRRAGLEQGYGAPQGSLNTASPPARSLMNMLWPSPPTRRVQSGGYQTRPEMQLSIYETTSRCST